MLAYVLVWADSPAEIRSNPEVREQRVCPQNALLGCCRRAAETLGMLTFLGESSLTARGRLCTHFVRLYRFVLSTT
jgi:hypothetical protein